MTRRYDIDLLLIRFDNDPEVLAQHIGVTARTVNRWIEAGGVPEDESDRVAVRCGTHPITLWGQAWIEPGLAAGESVQLSLFE